MGRTSGKTWSDRMQQRDGLLLAVLEMGQRQRRPDYRIYSATNRPLLGDDRRAIGARFIVPEKAARKMTNVELWIAELEADARFLDRDERNVSDLTTAATALREVCSGLAVEDEVRGGLVVASRQCPPSCLDLKNITVRGADFALLEVSFAEKSLDPPRPTGLIAKAWARQCGHKSIPFSIARRKKELASVFDRLCRLIQVQESMRGLERLF